jgi:polygalacturonase
MISQLSTTENTENTEKRTFRLFSVFSVVQFGLAGLTAIAGAQDRRTVMEPKIPAACTTLKAELKSLGDSTLSEPDEAKLDTRRIQAAIDSCTKGRAVVLAASGANRAFLSGSLQLREGITLVVDSGAILFASRDPREYDRTPGSCGVVNKDGKGCRPLILVERAPHAGVMGRGTIDGRGWAKLAGRDSSWWDLAQEAKVKALSQNCPRLVIATRSDDFTLYRITFKNSPNFHVMYERGDGFTAWDVTIRTPKTARNTDGIDPSSATNVTITHSHIDTGDDNVAIKAGSNGPATNMTIAHNRFYRGHGMSIGSETNGGARAIRVTDLTIDGADNGLRIKSNGSRGGLVEDVVYENVCIRRTKNPIYMDSHYSASPELDGNLTPVFRNITFRNVRVVDGGTVTLDGYDAERRLGLVFDGVMFDAASRITLAGRHADVTVGPRGTNLAIKGDDMRVIGSTRLTTADACHPERSER